METTSFAEIAEEFGLRVRKHIWCSVSTVDRAGRPRSRVLHPVWDGPTGWVTTYPTSHKAKHLAAVPYVSCAYVDSMNPMYVDAKASWVEDVVEKGRVWNFIKAQTPEPYGFDPGFIWKDGPGGADFGLLRLDPWRIEVYTSNPPNLPGITIWRPANS
jgi:general stress protein 26